MFKFDETSYNTKSAKEVVPFICDLVNPKSVLDVGCGIGTWLNVFLSDGLDVMGVDGNYIKPNELLIPEKYFKPVDLNNDFELGRKFDLVISLEVGEHLEETNADKYIKSLTRHSDVIIFSAAIPHQTGDRHINCQWPEYWRKKFDKNGFKCYDVFRERFWNNSNVEWWYKQNMFLYAKTGYLNDKLPKTINTILSFVHPEMLADKSKRLESPTIKTALASLKKAIRS